MSRSPTRRPLFLGTKLKSIRENWSPAALTQEEMANLVKQCLSSEFEEVYPELNREYISGYERGTRTVPPVILLAYALLANTLVEVLINDRLCFQVNPKFPNAERYEGTKPARRKK